MKINLLYLYLKDENGVTAINTIREVPNIPEGKYVVRCGDDKGIVIEKHDGKEPLKTVRFNKGTYMMKENKDGSVVLTPAPEHIIVDIEKNKKGKLETRPLTNAVRSLLEKAEVGIYGLLNDGKEVTVEKFK